jgi:hypothetical protein
MTVSGCTIELPAATGRAIITIVVQILKNVSSFFICRPNLQKHSSTIRARANQGNVASGIFRMRVLQRAVAVLHPLGGCIVLTREVSGKKNERNIPAILISVSRRQRAKRLKKIAPNKTCSARLGSGECNKSYGCSGCARRGRWSEELGFVVGALVVAAG